MTIRPIQSDDLNILFHFQLDEESNNIAFLHPRDREQFDLHWQKVLSDHSVVARAILLDDILAGSISCYPSNGIYYVGYWVGREYWGRGVATKALELLLEQVSTRPLHARVAESNIGSIRVLQKCGFDEYRREWSHETDRLVACEEVILRLPDSNRPNIYANLPESLPDELIEKLAGNNTTRIERIVSTGHASPPGFWYDQNQNEWVILLTGSATLLYDDGQQFELNAGDYLFIPAHQKHRVEKTSPNNPTVWLAVFFY